jgi:hypothetical protein
MAVRSERDYYSFEELTPQEWARRVRIYGGSILSNVTWDAVSVTYPDSTTEVYEFLTGGLSGSSVATVTVKYTNTSKQDILSVEKV